MLNFLSQCSLHTVCLRSNGYWAPTTKNVFTVFTISLLINCVYYLLEFVYENLLNRESINLFWKWNFERGQTKTQNLESLLSVYNFAKYLAGEDVNHHNNHTQTKYIQWEHVYCFSMFINKVLYESHHLFNIKPAEFTNINILSSKSREAILWWKFKQDSQFAPDCQLSGSSL